MIAHDKTSREIAAELYISVRTVERHRENICQKLDLHGSNALLRFADLAQDVGDLVDEIDVNPFVLLPKGAVALDCLVVKSVPSPSGRGLG